jgi:hypothetical protein
MRGIISHRGWSGNFREEVDLDVDLLGIPVIAVVAAILLLPKS